MHVFVRLCVHAEEDVTGIVYLRPWQWPVCCSQTENILITHLSGIYDTVCVCAHVRARGSYLFYLDGKKLNYDHAF